GTLLALVSVDHVSVWPAAVIVFREFTVMALRGVVAQGGGLVKPSTWGKAKAVTQYLALFLAFLRLPEKWGPWYLDQYVMAIAVIATIGSMWGYLTAFWQVIRSEPAHADRTCRSRSPAEPGWWAPLWSRHWLPRVTMSRPLCGRAPPRI